jgi:hypothetical protein
MVYQVRGIHEVLQQAISDGLLALGEPIMKTILWHLKEQGIFVDSRNEIDIRLFYQHLEEIVGNVAEVVMNEIYANLSQGNQVSMQLNPDDPVVDRIVQLLEVNRRRGAN